MASPPWANRRSGTGPGSQRVVRPSTGGAGAPLPSGRGPVGANGPNPSNPARAEAVRRPAGGAPSPQVPRGALAGTVRGSVAVEIVRRRFSGPRILAVACLAGIVGAPVLAARGHGAMVQNWLFATEGYAALLLAVLSGIARRRGSVLGDMADSALVFLPRRSGSARRRRPEFSTEVHRFRVETILGDTHKCTLLGRLTGGALKDGDFVHVSGRRSRSGELTATRIEVLSSANGVRMAGLTADRRTEFALARRADRLAVAATVLLVVGLLAGLALGAG